MESGALALTVEVWATSSRVITCTGDHGSHAGQDCRAAPPPPALLIWLRALARGGLRGELKPPAKAPWEPPEPPMTLRNPLPFPAPPLRLLAAGSQLRALSRVVRTLSCPLRARTSIECRF